MQSHVGMVLIDGPSVYHTAGYTHVTGQGQTQSKHCAEEFGTLAQLHLLCFLGPSRLSDSGRGEGEARFGLGRDPWTEADSQLECRRVHSSR